jgi:uncharacterized protein YbjT (DUF2867 family)
LLLRNNPVTDEEIAAFHETRMRNATRTILTPAHITGEREYTMQDALEILRYAVGLPSVLDNCNVAIMAALLVSDELPGVQDALAILRFLVNLPSPVLDEIWRETP